jgi:hypothetical protein
MRKLKDKIHTAKYERCVKEVKKEGADVNPYAVCESSIGYCKSIKGSHQKRKEC